MKTNILASTASTGSATTATTENNRATNTVFINQTKGLNMKKFLYKYVLPVMLVFSGGKFLISCGGKEKPPVQKHNVTVGVARADIVSQSHPQSTFPEFKQKIKNEHAKKEIDTVFMVLDQPWTGGITHSSVNTFINNLEEVRSLNPNKTWMLGDIEVGEIARTDSVRLANMIVRGTIRVNNVFDR